MKRAPTTLQKAPSTPALDEIISLLDRTHLEELQLGEVEAVHPLTTAPVGLQDYLSSHTRCVLVDRVAYSEKRSKIEELLNLLTAVHSVGCSMVLGLVGGGERIEFLLGVTTDSDDTDAFNRVQTGAKVLRAAVDGNFPGTMHHRATNAKLAQVLTGDSFQHAQAMAALTGIPALKHDDQERFVQGLDRFLDSMQGREFALVMVAEPIPDAELAISRQAYADLHTGLSVLEEQQIAVQVSQQVQHAKMRQEAVTTSTATTVSDTQSRTTTNNKSKSRPTNAAYALGVGMAVAGGVLGTLVAPGAGTAVGAALGAQMGGSLGLQLGGTQSKGKTKAKTKSRTESTTELEGVTLTEGDTVTTGEGTARTRTFTLKDRTVKWHLDRLDQQLERLDQGRRYGFWNMGIYVVGPSVEETQASISVLQGILRGGRSDLEPTRTVLWRRGAHAKNFEHALGSLQHLSHPRVRAPSVLGAKLANATDIVALLPTTLVSSDELALVMGFPEKSVPGVTVFRRTPFGRHVSRLSDRSSGQRVRLGRIHHLGRTSEAPVHLDVPSLCMHAFISGTTGSGKSNGLLCILERLMRLHDPVPFLVIEPAKREYARLLDLSSKQRPIHYLTAGIPGCPVLRINPFEFPEGVHVFEHLDRLIQVFNAAFPMYAAMPALLEEAMQRSYERSGWNLATSTCSSRPRRFPTLQTLVYELEAVVKGAGYSERLTSDYIGALVTRIRSLTRGIRGAILCPAPGEVTPVRQLLDEHCIVNLSSLGSPDTKALIMGLLLVRLYEHRQVQMETPDYADEVDARKLTHVTVVEEAHQLLRRQSTVVEQESANLGGMAVEMFANALSELRAWGEGIVVVDQSATAVDPSVLKNTNSKIQFRTPYQDDRVDVGEAMGLDTQQIEEVARLETGVAVVYQNDWVEPVLCKFDLSELPRKVAPPPAPSSIGRGALVALVSLPVYLNAARAMGTGTRLLQALNSDLATAGEALENTLDLPAAADLLPALYSTKRDSALEQLHSALFENIGREKPLAPASAESRGVPGGRVGLELVAALHAIFGLNPQHIHQVLRRARSGDAGWFEDLLDHCGAGSPS